MKRTLILLLLIIIIIPSYIIGINSLVDMDYKILSNTTEGNKIITNCGASSCEQLGMSDSVSVEIVKNRWYGRIVESSNDYESISNLYLFKLIKIPIRKNKINFISIHIVLISILLIVLMLTIILDILQLKSKKEETWEKQSDYYYL